MKISKNKLSTPVVLKTESPAIISLIKQAGIDRKLLRIHYTDSNGDVTVRDTEPYEIKQGKYWGYCLAKKGIRQFTLSNIVSAMVLNTRYTPRWPVKV